MKLVLTVFMITVLSVKVFAQNDGGSTLAFLRMGMGADRIAMGNVGTALTTLSGSNWYYNSAAHTFQKEKVAGIGYQFMNLDRYLGHLSVSFPIEPNGALGFAYVRAGVRDIYGTNSSGQHIGDLEYADNAIAANFGLNFKKKIGIGLTLMNVFSNLSGVEYEDYKAKSSGMLAFFGVLYAHSTNLAFGLQLQGAGGRISWDTETLVSENSSDKEDDVPLIGRIGVSYKYKYNILVSTDFAYNFESDEDSEVLPMIGAEWKHPLLDEQEFALRAGFNGYSPTVGFGVLFNVVNQQARLDYCFYPERNSGSFVNQVNWIFKF